jgi:putative FmdB family regulatory protein
MSGVVTMPTYEYKCADCNNEYEQARKITDKEPVHCPKCKSVRQVKKISKSSIIFRGSGFTKSTTQNP